MSRKREDYLNPDVEDGRVPSVQGHGQETKMEVVCRDCRRRSFDANHDMLDYDREKGEYQCKCDSYELVWVCTGVPLNLLQMDELSRLRDNYHLGLAVHNDGTPYPCGAEYENPGPETQQTCRKCDNPMYNG